MKKWWETGGIISLPHYMTQHIPVKGKPPTLHVPDYMTHNTFL